MASERKHDFKARVIHEIKQLFFMFFYLWLVCGLFVLNQTVILGERNITYVAVHGVALLNALVLAKVMLIAEDLRIGNRFAQRALIYPILYKAAVFSILFIVAYTLEKVIVGYFGGESASASLPYLGSLRLGHTVRLLDPVLHDQGDRARDRSARAVESRVPPRDARVHADVDAAIVTPLLRSLG